MEKRYNFVLKVKKDEALCKTALYFENTDCPCPVEVLDICHVTNIECCPSNVHIS